MENGTIRKLEYGYDFLFAFHSNYGPILCHFRDSARYWSKIAIFHTPCIPVHFSYPDPRYGDSHRNITIPLGTGKLECSYQMVKKL